MANKRPINQSIKSNVKCEHCQYWKKYDWEVGRCTKQKTDKKYYNRCGKFDWDKSKEYV